jgi:hypothetical protein
MQARPFERRLRIPLGLKAQVGALGANLTHRLKASGAYELGQCLHSGVHE